MKIKIGVKRDDSEELLKTVRQGLEKANIDGQIKLKHVSNVVAVKTISICWSNF